MRRITLLLFVALGVVFTIALPLSGDQDLIRYWSASRLLGEHRNPYDAVALRSVEEQARPGLVPPGDVVVAWNPPWLLQLMLPLALLPFEVAVPTWLLINLALICLSVFLCWRNFGSPRDVRGYLLALSAGVLSGNTLILLGIGQISSLLLIAYLLTVRCLRRGQDGWAGATLLLLTIKPHISYLLLLTLFVWLVARRRWKPIAWAAGLAALSAILASLSYPAWLADYGHTLLSLPYRNLHFSTLGSFVFRQLGIAGFNLAGLLLLPLAWYIGRQLDRPGQDWLSRLNLVLVLSVPLAPYGFSFDHVILLPAVVELIAWLRNQERGRPLAWLVGGGLLLAYASLLFLLKGPVTYSWLVLPSLLISILYLAVWKDEHGNRRRLVVQQLARA